MKKTILIIFVMFSYCHLKAQSFDENSTKEETISFIQNKMECCFAQQMDNNNDESVCMKDVLGELGVTSLDFLPPSIIKLKLVGKTLYFKDNLSVDYENDDLGVTLSIHGCIAAPQYLFLLGNDRWNDNSLHKTAIEFIITDTETREEVINAFAHLRSLLNKELK